jgi:LPXTG-motif cell wall-anchored protein
MKKKILSLIFILNLLLAGLPMLSLTAYAEDFQTDSLNNRASTTGSGAATSVKVDSENATTNLVVKLTAPGETVTIYKVASVRYDTVTKKYSEPYWVETVSDWLKSNDVYSTDGSIKTAYASPKNLSSASQSTWSEFYKYLLYNRETNGPLNVIEYGSGSTTENDAVVYTGKLEPYRDSVTLADDADVLEVSFNNLELGIYAVMVTADAKRFSPVVTDLTPRVNGPEGNYYVDSVYFAELKSADATIDKKINNRQEDAIRIGEVVDFTIDFTLPTLYRDRVTYTRAMDQPYYLYVEDYMSPSYTLYDTNSDGVADFRDLSFLSESDVPGTIGGVFSTTEVEYYEIADSTYNLAELTADEDYFVLTNENVSEYTSSSSLSAIEGYEEGHTYYAVKVSAPVYTFDTVRTRTNADNVECTYLKLNINVGALKQLIKNDEENRSFDSATVTMAYKAIVTDQCEVNSEANYNTATIVYEGTSGISDTVRGYTYGVQVIKVDGDTGDTLAGAQFNLYKEVNTYLKVNDEFVWKADVSGNDADKLPLTYEEIKADIAEKGADSIYYTFEEVMTSAGTTEFGVEYENGDVIAKSFVKYTNGYINASTEFNGQITSEATETGVIVKGLDEGNYILMETKAPSGYNALSEDILFTINRIDDETAELQFNGSLCGYFDGYGDDKQLIENGLATLRVLNYRGLTLPSTGGAGILLFTIIGITIMSSALVMMIIRQRKVDPRSYM